MTGEAPTHLPRVHRLGKLITACPRVSRVFAEARRVAPTTVGVLIDGPTGVGKTALGQEIHALSSRPGPLVEVNCARLGGDVGETALFGHIRGAFTGASHTRVGHLARASTGTLLLDELALLPEDAQTNLLTVLESGLARPVGSATPSRVDLRIVSATHADLATEVRLGRFREDLFHRLVGVQLTLPGLAERPRADIDVLIDTFLGEGRTLTSAARERLAQGARRGNVRYLKKVIGATLQVCRHDHIDVGDLILPPSLSAPGSRQTRTPTPADRERLAAVATALGRTGGNASAAARDLGMRRSTLLGLLKRHGLRPRDHATWAPHYLTSDDVPPGRQA